MKKYIHSNQAPKAIGPYSQAVLANDTLYVSGQLPIDLKTNEVVTNIYQATTLCLEHILSIVKETGMTKENIVKCHVYLKNLNDFTRMNDAYSVFFGEHKPARVAMEVSRLPKDVLVEIDCIAVL